MGASRSCSKGSVHDSKELQDLQGQMTHLLRRLKHAKLKLACVARGCLATFRREDVLYKHIRDVGDNAHNHCAKLLNSGVCGICGKMQSRMLQHYYFHHPSPYQFRIRELIGCDIPISIRITAPPKCFDIAFVTKYCKFSDRESDIHQSIARGGSSRSHRKAKRRSGSTTPDSSLNLEENASPPTTADTFKAGMCMSS